METVILVYQFAADFSGGLRTFIVPPEWTLPPLIDSLSTVVPYYFNELTMWILGH
jgi:hypothetical protein